MIVLLLTACAWNRTPDTKPPEDTASDTAPACTPVAWYRDGDRDSYGDPAALLSDCVAPAGYVASNDDCAPWDESIHPGATEYCDGLDHDCDGLTLEANAVDRLPWYPDADGDGFGVVEGLVIACVPPAGTVGNTDDCDDTRADVNPAAPEVCDDADVDEDCDGLADEADAWAAGGTAWWPDEDADGYGDADADPVWACTGPEGWVANDDDCDDLDTGEPAIVWRDADGDGVGDPDSPVATCAVLAGYLPNDDDCDDTDPDVYPGAPETDCTDPVDYNCDGSGGTTDVDGDGALACEDCDDADPARSWLTAELCNGIDDNCDGRLDIDAIDGAVWYPDLDGDRYGDDAGADTFCANPGGWVTIGGDCDDSSGITNPGEYETCSGAGDENCDGVINEAGAKNCHIYYEDNDGDAYGKYGACLCAAEGVWTAPSGYDCDDADPAIHPGVADACGDGIDNDCDQWIACEAALPAALVTGEASYDYGGWAVAFVGDQTGDGVDDLLIGATGGGSGHGAAYAVSGTTPAPTSLATSAWILTGAAPSDYAGSAVSGGRDLNGDGTPDLLIGAEYNDTGASYGGAVYLVYGGGSGVFDLSAAPAAFLGARSARIGGLGTIQLAGDLSGDNIPDVVIGDERDATYTGRVSVTAAAPSGGVAVETLGIQITGDSSWCRFGAAVVSPGDLDGDGLDDLAVGAPEEGSLVSRGGATFLFRGPLDASLRGADADLVIYGEVPAGFVGALLAPAGDADGNGLPDLLIGATGRTGAVWLLKRGFDAGPLLSSVTTRFEGDGNLLAGSITGGADLDGSGVPDVAIGIPNADLSLSDQGAVALFVDPGAGGHHVADATLLLTGAYSSDQLGKSIVGGSDLDGDGCDELLIGVRDLDLAGFLSGGAYLVSGCTLW